MVESFLQLGQVDDLAGQAVHAQRHGRPLGLNAAQLHGVDGGAKVNARLPVDALGGQAAVVDPLLLTGAL